MAFQVRIDRDSLTPDGKHRLTTFQLEFPRKILAEVNTHRVLSRNASSSRAIPIERMLEKIKVDPYIPRRWGKNQKGMKAHEKAEDQKALTKEWLDGRDYAVSKAERMMELGAHKEDVNRILEPWAWTRQVLTATSFSNFFALRTDEQTTDDFLLVARAMYVALRRSIPARIPYGGWHLPFIRDSDVEKAKTLHGSDFEAALCRWSTARCARVSYETFERRTPTTEQDEALYDKLVNSYPKHMSPTEHQATPAGELTSDAYRSNFVGWVQYRKTIPLENVSHFVATEEQIASWEIPEEIFRGDGLIVA